MVNPLGGIPLTHSQGTHGDTIIETSATPESGSSGCVHLSLALVDVPITPSTPNPTRYPRPKQRIALGNQDFFLINRFCSVLLFHCEPTKAIECRPMDGLQSELSTEVRRRPLGTNNSITLIFAHTFDLLYILVLLCPTLEPEPQRRLYAVFGSWKYSEARDRYGTPAERVLLLLPPNSPFRAYHSTRISEHRAEHEEDENNNY